MRVTDLLILAEVYRTATGIRFWTLSALATGSANTFYRIRQGKGCHSRTAERAWDWFSDNWPPGVEWPDTVPRPCGCRMGRVEAAE
jgi:hypothetical protein